MELIAQSQSKLSASLFLLGKLCGGGQLQHFMSASVASQQLDVAGATAAYFSKEQAQSLVGPAAFGDRAQLDFQNAFVPAFKTVPAGVGNHPHLNLLSHPGASQAHIRVAAQ